jgi:transcriptional regulator with XRE-family HTH domain
VRKLGESRHLIRRNCFALVDVIRYRGSVLIRQKGIFSNGLGIQALGERLRVARTRTGLSLDEFAARSGVSRSMVSEVERGAKVPTVLILDRIATSLGTSIARLLGDEREARVIVLRRKEQNVANDPSGWERRILSPVLPGIEFEFMRTTIGPRVDVGAFSPHAHGSREYLAIESGTLLLTIDGTNYELMAGDSIFYAGDCVHAFRNSSNRPCIYYLAMDVGGESGGMQQVQRRAAKEKRGYGNH